MSINTSTNTSSNTSNNKSETLWGSLKSSIDTTTDTLWGSLKSSMDTTTTKEQPPPSLPTVAPNTIKIIRRKNRRIPTDNVLNTKRDNQQDENKFSNEKWDNKNDVKRAIYEFYKLKNKYEKNKSVFKEYLIQAKNKKQKKLKQKKPFCVKCGRDVGNIFIVNHKEYIAKCGDTIQPCQLSILIEKEIDTRQYEEYMAELKEDIEENKKNIIMNKLSLLFGYKTEAQTLKDVENEINDYDGNNILLQNLINNYKNIIMSEERSEDIKKLHNEIEKYISEIQYLTNNSNNSIKNTKRIAEIYVNDLLPRTKLLREKKYEKVDFVNNQLHQFPVSLEKKEIIEKDDNTRVIHFFV